MPACSLDSEYLPLKAVLLCKPCNNTYGDGAPSKILYNKKVDFKIIEKEYSAAVELYRKLKVQIYFIDSGRIQNSDCRYSFNLMFTRDLFFMTSRGAILSSMASGVRRDEVFYAERAFKNNGISIRKIIQGDATFEGADALWVTPRVVAVGVGNRTNDAGFKQIEGELRKDGVKCVYLPAPRGSIHLLGALQFLDKGLALVRTGLVIPEIVSFLKQSGIKFIEISENAEVKEKQALNFVTIAPKKIIMPAGCPGTKKILKRYGIEVIAEVSVSQFINAGGGLACASGILSRAS